VYDRRRACPELGKVGLNDAQGRLLVHEEHLRRIGMEVISRRQFFSKSAVGITYAGYLASIVSKLRANPLGMPIGFQSWSVQKLLQQDFDGTLKEMAQSGFQSMELCSPPSYRQFGFGGLVNLKGSELREKINGTGLKCESCHYQWGELKASLDERIEYAKDLGLKQMILSTFGLPARATLDDWKRNAGELNKMGEKAHAAGIQLGFHNHDFEFKKIDGRLIYDELLSVFDPKLIKLQFQVAVISLGYEADKYFTEYPGRFVSLHLVDWSPADKKQVPVGQGAIDMKKLFAAAKVGGIQNYFLEMPLDLMKPSVPYLRALKV
jgi:sugar phosphate isomerase/epimerase